MQSSLWRVVLDTNVLLRGMLSGSSFSGLILAAADRRDIVALTSRSLLAEYRAVLLDPQVADRFPSLTRRAVDLTLRRLRYLGDYLATPGVRFSYPRDPRDEKLIELAIAGHATHIVSLDEDLLSLTASRTDAGRRFRQRLPQTQVVKPRDFLELLDAR